MSKRNATRANGSRLHDSWVPLTTHLQCDYCGEEISPDDTWITITEHGRYWHADDPAEWSHVNEPIGHYHSRPIGPEPSCYRRILDAIGLVHELAPTLENIPTASGQKIARLRSKHRMQAD